VSQTTRQEVLRRAVELIGKKDLATRLGVTQGVLDGWLAGYLLMPDRKFLALTELLEKLDERKK
jgi:phosphoserine phosphatase